MTIRSRDSGPGSLALIVVLLVAGCAEPPSAPDEAIDEAGSDPGERWFFNRTEAGDRFLTLGRPQPTSIRGPYSNEDPTNTTFEMGPFSGWEGSHGFAAGAPLDGFVVYSCETPATMQFEIRVFSAGVQVGRLEGEESFNGSFLPLAMMDDISLSGRLSADIQAGETVQALLVIRGCALPALGHGGDWVPWIRFGHAP